MTPIKITSGNTSKIQSAIDAVQKLARIRTIDAADVFEAVEVAEKKLGRLLYKKDWTDLRIVCDPSAQKFANAYDGIPESTRFYIERGATGWVLLTVARNRCGYKGQRCYLHNRSEQLAKFATDHFGD